MSYRRECGVAEKAGAGIMGTGIARSAFQVGFPVTLAEVSVDAQERGISGIEKQLSRRVERGRNSSGNRNAVLGRIRASELVEDLSGKQEVFSVKSLRTVRLCIREREEKWPGCSTVASA